MENLNLEHLSVNGWGGARKGSGRKAKPKGKSYTFRSTPEVEAILEKISGGKSDFINTAILTHARSHE